MNYSRQLFILALLTVSISSPVAWADHGYGGRGHVGISIGIPLGYPYYPPYYPSYYYPPVIAAPAPPVYVEQGTSAPDAGQSNYWYYCAASQTYYPYVRECPGGWLTVVPQSSSPAHP